MVLSKCCISLGVPGFSKFFSRFLSIIFPQFSTIVNRVFVDNFGCFGDFLNIGIVIRSLICIFALMNQAEHILQESGIRPTAIRLMVLKEIIEHDRAFTLADMEHRMVTIDRSTLFRTLMLFVEHKLLHEIDNGSGSKLFCRCDCHHHHHHTPHIHFTCTSCGETFCIKDIDMAVIPHPAGYEVNEINLVMKGLCPKCKQGGK